jgi:GNAT superfamily N-acetyltransferase
VTYVPLIQAGPVDTEMVATCIAMAFRPLEVAAWLVPDAAEREGVLRADFRILVEHALAHGDVWTTLNHTGVAVWFPRDAAPPPGIPDYDARLDAACGRHADRFRTLDAVFTAHHPQVRHLHLAFLAVRPQRQRHGIGSALLEERHTRLDLTGTPAYLEASSLDARRLYLRHGYADHGPPMELPDGPRLWPMWREPRPNLAWI